MENIKGKTLFVGLGAQKTGTTWMADYLDQHPEVFVSPIKELHYFNSKYLYKSFENIFINKIKRNASKLDIKNKKEKLDKLKLYIERLEMKNNRRYLRFFDKRVSDTHRVFGEITPAYSMLSSEHFQEIYNLHDNVLFIFGMRNPIERFWSQLRYARKFHNNFDPIENFEKKISDEGFLLRTDYSRTIKELESVVPKENIFYYFYEELFGENGEEVVRRLCSFLSIKYIEPDFGKSINVSKRIELDDERKKIALDKFGNIIAEVEKRFGYVPDSWKV